MASKENLEEQIQEMVDGYLDRMTRNGKYTREEAKNCLMTKLIAESYHNENRPRSGDAPLPRTELDIGCKGGC